MLSKQDLIYLQDMQRLFVRKFCRGILTKTKTRKTLNCNKVYPKQKLFVIYDL